MLQDPVARHGGARAGHPRGRRDHAARLRHARDARPIRRCDRLASSRLVSVVTLVIASVLVLPAMLRGQATREPAGRGAGARAERSERRLRESSPGLATAVAAVVVVDDGSSDATADIGAGGRRNGDFARASREARARRFAPDSRTSSRSRMSTHVPDSRRRLQHRPEEAGTAD